MEINEILKTIPESIGEMFSSIYCVDDTLAYVIKYNGESLKVLNNISKDEFINKLSKYNISKLLDNDNIVKVVDDTLIKIKTINDYKLVFTIDIPKEIASSQERKILLIADDSPVITKFFTKTFEDNYDVLVASNGEEAINLFEENKDKNLVGLFIDLQMPVKSGYDVLDYFKENNLFENYPVSVISGEDSTDGIARATSYNIIDMLQKPFNATSAESIVNKTISFSPKNK